MTIVTGPGIYRDLPEGRYHADDALAPELGRSLSQSGAKTLLASHAATSEADTLPVGGESA